MIKKNLLIAGAMLLILTAFSVNKAQAQTCVMPPSCEDLGYTMTEADCGNAVKFLKCPHDQTKMFCLSLEDFEGDSVAHVGDIMYSDKTFSTELIKTKIPIGVVFDEANRLAVALDETSLYWSVESEEYVDIPDLMNCTDNVFTCGKGGKENTAIIMAAQTKMQNLHANNKNKIYYPAANYCYTYQPSSVSSVTSWFAAGKWFLPSIKELKTLYNNKAVVNASLQKVNAVTLSSDTYWSSTEYRVSAWNSYMSNGSKNFTSKNRTFYVRPVISF